MNKVQRMLMIVFWSNVVVVAIVILTGETNFMPYDRFKGDTKTEFYLLTIMELLTICIIPLALRLFKFNKVKTDLLQKREQALARWGIIRLDMLCLPCSSMPCFTTSICTPHSATSPSSCLYVCSSSIPA